MSGDKLRALQHLEEALSRAAVALNDARESAPTVGLNELFMLTESRLSVGRLLTRVRNDLAERQTVAAQRWAAS